MIGIIHYGAGNIYSLSMALERIEANYKIIDKPKDFHRFDRYIIPGVGHAKPAMIRLKESGLIPLIKQTDKPVLGICLGMQLLSSFSEEGSTPLLDIISLQTKRFQSASLKIPHMGWNQVTIEQQACPLYKNIKNETYFYFVHSYYLEYRPEYAITTTYYGLKFSSSIQKNNYFGVQFHPEKSGPEGEALLNNFNNLII